MFLFKAGFHIFKHNRQSKSPIAKTNQQGLMRQLELPYDTDFVEIGPAISENYEWD